MALFDKSPFEKKKQDTQKNIREVVLDMISQGAPKEQVVGNLVSAGLGQDESSLLYESMKKEYEQLFTSHIGKAVQDAANKRQQETISNLEREVERLRRDLELHFDLKNMDQKGQTDSQMRAMQAEIQGLKSDLFSTKVNLEKEMKKVESELDDVRLKGFIRVLASIVTLLIGGVMAILSATQMYNATMAGISEITLSLALYIVVFLGGIIFTWLGVKVYTSEK